MKRSLSPAQYSEGKRRKQFGDPELIVDINVKFQENSRRAEFQERSSKLIKELSSIQEIEKSDNKPDEQEPKSEEKEDEKFFVNENSEPCKKQPTLRELFSTLCSNALDSNPKVRNRSPMSIKQSNENGARVRKAKQQDNSKVQVSNDDSMKRKSSSKIKVKDEKKPHDLGGRRAENF